MGGVLTANSLGYGTTMDILSRNLIKDLNNLKYQIK